ncbi:Dyp-type peroxidase [Rhodoferax ferrireducens]|uniref:Dyp-type peroxidase n=1 Tax=Rhodoferax ferrireducens TaxID=192843 RepID=UPI000E0CC1B6|nr:Dyp-type peroxidase [Rhodoferax ferrireducens]
MSLSQAAILAPVPLVGRYLFFSITPVPEQEPAQALRDSLKRLVELADGTQVLVGLGSELVEALGAQVPGLHPFEAMSGHGVQVPSTPIALCCWLRGSDHGELFHLRRRLEKALAPALRLERLVEAFRHGQGPTGHGQDLTGYEDGTENPAGEAAQVAALVQEGAPGLVGSSFMALQQWLHDFDAFDAMATREQDNTIGRRRSDNEELDDAPPSAHVKRTAQEDFEPAAFVLRRSMPWAQGKQAGLMFVAFGKSFDAFEAQMRRMAGQEDGITDALFRISKPVNGAFFWCPPLREGRLDLRLLDL